MEKEMYFKSGNFRNSQNKLVNIADVADSMKAKEAIAITPNDTTTIESTSGIYIGGSGDIAVTMKDGSNVTFKSLAAGVIHPLCVTKVKATGTTATNILAVY